MNKRSLITLVVISLIAPEIAARHYRTLTIVNMTQGPVSILIKDHKQPLSAAKEELRIKGIQFDDASNYDTRMKKEISVLDSQDVFVRYHQVKSGVDTVVQQQIPDCATHFVVPTNVTSDPLLTETKKEKVSAFDNACVENKALEKRVAEQLAQDQQ